MASTLSKRTGWVFTVEFVDPPGVPSPLGDFGETLMERLLDQEKKHPKILTDSSIGTTDPADGPRRIEVSLAVRELDLAEAYAWFYATMEMIGAPEGCRFQDQILELETEPLVEEATYEKVVNAAGEVVIHVSNESRCV